MTKEEYEKKLAEARKKLGKDFITSTPSPRVKEKSWRLKQIEAEVKKHDPEFNDVFSVVKAIWQKN